MGRKNEDLPEAEEEVEGHCCRWMKRTGDYCRPCYFRMTADDDSMRGFRCCGGTMLTGWWVRRDVGIVVGAPWFVSDGYIGVFVVFVFPFPAQFQFSLSKFGGLIFLRLRKEYLIDTNERVNSNKIRGQSPSRRNDYYLA